MVSEATCLMGKRIRMLVLMVWVAGGAGARVSLAGVEAGVTGEPQAAPSKPAQPEMHEPGMSGMHEAGAASMAPLRVKANGKSEEFSADALKAMAHVSITVANGHTEKSESYSGVPLIALLSRMGMTEKPHGKDLSFYVVAEGADGYKAVYSTGEVTPDIHDGTVIVADAVDGKGLGSSGQFQLVATGEKHPARWVRNLVSVEVVRVP